MKYEYSLERKISSQEIIKYNANSIRNVFQTLVTQNFVSVFRDSYRYWIEDLNPKHIIDTTEDIFSTNPDCILRLTELITIFPNGEIISILMRHEFPESDGEWRFCEASPKKANDIDVISYGPVLLERLANQVKEVLSKQDNPKSSEIMSTYSIAKSPVKEHINELSETATKIIMQ